MFAGWRDGGGGSWIGDGKWGLEVGKLDYFGADLAIRSQISDRWRDDWTVERKERRWERENHGHAEKDEAWVPLSKKIYKQLDYSTKFLRFTIPFPLLAQPLYLDWDGFEMKNVTLELHEAKIYSRKGTYKNRNKNDENDDKIFVAFEMDSIPEKRPFLLSRDFASVRPSGIKVEPFQVFVMWISSITYRNHHSHEQKLPWYRGVTRAAKPVLGMYYKEPQKSGVVPFHLISDLVRSLQQNHYVSDNGDVVFYQTDTELSESGWTKIGLTIHKKMPQLFSGSSFQ